MAGATKDATISSRALKSEEQAQNKKMRIDLVLSERMITFETASRNYSRSFTFAPTEQEWAKCEGNLNGTIFHTRYSLFTD